MTTGDALRALSEFIDAAECQDPYGTEFDAKVDRARKALAELGDQLGFPVI